jgi:two-component system, chemotaxis family, sensor kinase Cph1
LSNCYQRAAAFQDKGSGVLAATLSAEEPWLVLWFRVEQVETVNWAGDPHKSDSEATLQALTPRSSFHAWKEIVRGCAPAWTLPEIDASRRLRAALLDVQQNWQVQELNRQLINAMRDKDSILQQNKFLIREANHRVQNSLQIVSSYLALQARVSENPELITALKEARGRISAVALVHRRLYRGDQVKMVDAALYVEELCADTLAFMGRDWAQHLSVNASSTMISADRAVTLGLLLTELLINVNKHAYGGRVGPIEIELIEENAVLRLIVADKGTGEVSHTKGFGLLIIRGLAAQLGGQFAYTDNNPGLRVVITMPSGDAHS